MREPPPTADCMLRQLDDDRSIHKALAVTTVSGQPGFLKFFLTEGIGKKTALPQVGITRFECGACRVETGA